MASGAGSESGQGSAKAKGSQSQSVIPLIVYSDNELSTQSVDQRIRGDSREGQLLSQPDRASSEAVLEAMTTDAPMVSPVQSLKPSPASKKTPVTGVQSGGKGRWASVSLGSGKPGQSGMASLSADSKGTAGDVQSQ